MNRFDLSGCKLTLHSYWRSSCSWRVRTVLNILEIPFEYSSVPLLNDGGKQLPKEYMAKNPNKRVPVLEIKDQNGKCVSITESSAIIDFVIENIEAKTDLYSSDPVEKAGIKAVASHIACNIQPLQNICATYKVQTEFNADMIEWGGYWIERGFEALEKMLEKTAGKYCFGDRITMADVYLSPQVYNANRFKVDMSKYPIISRIHEELSKEPAFEKAKPENQPDAA